MDSLINGRLAVIDTDNNVIAVGPLTKQPATVANRVVLRYILANLVFAVHTECFPHYPDLGNSYYIQGDYFQQHQLADAVKRFGDKISDSHVYMGSVYRQD